VRWSMLVVAEDVPATFVRHLWDSGNWVVTDRLRYVDRDTDRPRRDSSPATTSCRARLFADVLARRRVGSRT